MHRNHITNYHEIPAGHYDDALTKGNRVQQYWHREKFKVVLRELGSLKGKKLLDIGCGPGTFLSLVPQGYACATGIDIAQKQIGFAREKFAANKQLKWIVGDPLTAVLDTYDVITIVELIEHLDQAYGERLFARVQQHLNADGVVVITTPNYRSFWPMIEWLWSHLNVIDYREQHVTHFTRKKLRNLLECHGFNVVRQSTFYIISPFLASVSPCLARAVQRIEERVFSRWGSLIMCKATLKTGLQKV